MNGHNKYLERRETWESYEREEYKLKMWVSLSKRLLGMEKKAEEGILPAGNTENQYLKDEEVS